MSVMLAPSLLAANKSDLLSEVKLVNNLGCEFLHFDVMDGKFVSNTSFSIDEFKMLEGKHTMVNDVHIMVSDPLDYGRKYASCGADIVTFHYEALNSDEERINVISAIKSCGAKVGMSIKPATDVKVLFPFLDKLYLVLVMSVEPGLGGQKFILGSLDKIRSLKKVISDKKLSTLIEVDGGINDVTGKECKKSGADILVAGSYLFGHEDIKERVSLLR